MACSRFAAWQAASRAGFTLVLLVLVALGSAQAVDDDGLYRKFAPGSDLARLPATLVPLIEAQRLGLAPSTAHIARARQAVAPGSDPDHWRLRLDADVTPEVLTRIAATGTRIIRTSERWHEVQVEATVAQVDLLLRIPGVHRIAVPSRPRVRSVGTVASTADSGLKADQARTVHGVTGAGLKIGVLSDSLRSTTAMRSKGGVTGTAPNAVLSGTTPQVSGDLPATIQIVKADDVLGGTDEGEGMMELIHDLAPDAALAFAAVGQLSTQADFADAIIALADAGCQIIVDDIGFADEPVFQDGPIAQAVDAVNARGKLHFSACGNSGSMGIITTYADISPTANARDGVTMPDGTDFHNWGIAGSGSVPAFLPLTVAANATLNVTLEWNQPYADFGLGSGSEIDLDLFLFDAASPTANILKAGGDAQGDTGKPAGNPFEFLSFTNSTSTAKTVFLAVDHFSGPAGFRMSVLIDGQGITSTAPSSVFNGPSIFGHAAARGVVSVAALFAGSLANPTVKGPFGGDPVNLCAETFSSRGGRGANGLEFYFDTAGRPLTGAPQRRDKPDLTAPDGSQTLLFGFISPSVNPTFPSFFGTSAAAPHAAAVAALAWEGAGSFTNAEILARMKATATDIVATNPLAAAGPDASTGFGLVKPLDAVMPRPRQVATSAAAGTYSSGDIPISLTFSRPVTVTGSPTLALNTVPARTARFSSASGSTVNFVYTIVRGDVSAKLDIAGTSALNLNGGSIGDSFGRALTTLPAPGTAGSLASANIVVQVASITLAIAGSPANSTSPAFSFVITSPVDIAAFDSTKLSVRNGILGSVTKSGNRTIQVDVTATDFGQVTLTAAAGFLQDAAANPNAAAEASVTFVSINPLLTLTPSVTSIQAGNPLTVQLEFSKPVLVLGSTAVHVNGGTLTGLTGSGTLYTASLTAGSGPSLTVSVEASLVLDADGNHLGNSPLATIAVTSATPVDPPASGGSGGGGGCGLGSGTALSGLLLGLALRRRRHRV